MSKSKKDQPLDEREQAFVREYVADPDRNATAAAMRAGFSPNNPKSAKVTASKLRKDERIKSAILEAEQGLAATEKPKPVVVVDREPEKRRPPVAFSEEVFEYMMEEIACGRSVSGICREEGMPHAKSFWRWLYKRPELVPRYQAAKAVWSHAVGDELQEIAADASQDIVKMESNGKTVYVQNNARMTRLKLHSDNMRHLMAAGNPRVYGNKTIFEDATPPDTRTDEEIMKAMADRIAKLKSRGINVPSDLVPPVIDVVPEGAA